MKAVVENRYPEAGYVYVANTRMIFAPHSAANRVEKVEGEPLVLQPANWGTPIRQEIHACVAALKKAYLGREVSVQ